MSPIFVPVIVVAVLLIGGGVTLYHHFFSTAAVTKRKLRAHQARMIRYVREGETVKVQGEVLGDGELLSAPISGRPCVAWQVLVRQRRQRGKNSSWIEIVNEEECTSFLLRDRSGQLLIQDPLASMALDFDERGSSGFMRDPSPELSAFLSRRGHSTENFFGFNRATEWREGVIEPGERVAALGLARRVEREGGSLFALVRNGEQRVLLSDVESTLDE